VPMLPEALSAGLCSLHEGVDRACLAAEITIASDGSKLRHRFHRGIMRSPAALSYEEAQAAIEGRPSARAAPLVEPVLRPLYVAYAALKQAREARQPLELDLPERRIELSPKGKVTSVAFRDRFDAHRLVEEFVVLANVCAAETLIAKRTPLLFRVHEAPEETKLDALRQTAKAAGFPLAKGQVLRTRHLNALLNAAAGSDEAELINLSTLRSMQQAFYSPENLGHFGLALRNYAHFTSPIRRYADLVVHRALIAAHSWVEDGLTEADIETLDKTANHISQTERRSMMAERDTIDRYLAAYLSDRVGGTFAGRISGIARFGVFVKLDETGADGLLPIRELGNEYFHHDREANTLMGAETGREITVGLPVVVRLAEAAPLTGGLSFELMELGGEMPAKGPKRRPRRPPKRSARKVIRRRK
ncbi:MAG: RNB domain-containing ribonuclease, partial [Pseudomonadota bacterium]